jgi:hypothetical protein
MAFFKKSSDYRDLIIAYKRVFSTPEGKRVLFDLMDRGDVLNSHGGDPIKEGRRSLVLEVMKKVNINLKELDQLLAEQGDKVS